MMTRTLGVVYVYLVYSQKCEVEDVEMSHWEIFYQLHLTFTSALSAVLPRWHVMERANTHRLELGSWKSGNLFRQWQSSRDR
jgi:hypothetical protein